jgi:phosphoribosylformylglycinamidine cyclo-ligase
LTRKESDIMTKGMTYQVDYDPLDLFKVRAQEAGFDTQMNLIRSDFSEVPGTRGESAYVFEHWGYRQYLALVHEGLGTKHLVAQAMEELTGSPEYYEHIARDAVAMIVNDLAVVGAHPALITMYLSVEDASWFKKKSRWECLLRGWSAATREALGTFACGETPALRGVIERGTFDLSGAALGFIKPKERRVQGNVAAGDVMVGIQSSGIHANGLTLARALANRLDPSWRRILRRAGLLRSPSKGYLERLEDGWTFGEHLLIPTIIYVRLVQECLDRKIPIHYLVHLTGHGWRKLMRLEKPFAYVVDYVPPTPPVFRFIEKRGNVTNREMYGTFNMGVGYVFYVPEGAAAKVIETAESLRLQAWRIGRVFESNTRKVLVQPKGIEFSGDTLKIR